MITTKKFEQKMEEIFNFDMLEKQGACDTELAHEQADNLMCKLLSELGYGNGVRLFKLAKKWYS